MRRRVYLRKKHIFKIKNKRKVLLYFSFILIIFTVYFFIKLIGDMAVPTLTKYAKIEASKLTNIIVNRTVEKVVNDDLNLDDLYIINKDSNNNITMMDFNTIEVNNLLTKIINNIQNNLQKIEEGNLNDLNISDLGLEEYNKENLERGIIYRIPIGVITDTTILSNLGPSIPVKVSLNGKISGNISTKVTNYGINNALLETIINLEINQLVMLPVASDEMMVTTSIPIAMKLVQGIVPNYYFNGTNKNLSTANLLIE